MDIERAIKELDDLDGTDRELLHGDADEILSTFIATNGYPEVAKAYRDARSRVGFWYA